jgi:hypothetical protein
MMMRSRDQLTLRIGCHPRSGLGTYRHIVLGATTMALLDTA